MPGRSNGSPSFHRTFRITGVAFLNVPWLRGVLKGCMMTLLIKMHSKEALHGHGVVRKVTQSWCETLWKQELGVACVLLTVSVLLYCTLAWQRRMPGVSQSPAHPWSAPSQRSIRKKVQVPRNCWPHINPLTPHHHHHSYSLLPPSPWLTRLTGMHLSLCVHQVIQAIPILDIFVKTTQNYSSNKWFFILNFQTS